MTRHERNGSDEAGARKRLQGFTIVEMMMVLTILVILSILTVPAVKGGLAHYRFAIAADDFVNQIIFARVHAASRSKAYKLQVTPASGNKLGSITLTEGSSTHCASEDFDPDSGSGAIEDVRTIDFTAKHPDARIRTLDQSGIANYGLCFKPDGRVLQVSPPGSTNGGGVEITAATGYSDGEAIFRLELMSANGTPTGIVKVIIVPYNGIPRVELP